jgi:hypothetical protein
MSNIMNQTEVSVESCASVERESRTEAVDLT